MKDRGITGKSASCKQPSNLMIEQGDVLLQTRMISSKEFLGQPGRVYKSAKGVVGLQVNGGGRNVEGGRRMADGGVAPPQSC